MITVNEAKPRLDLRRLAVDRVLDSSGFAELPVTGQHAALVVRLPLHHRDHVDRLLVAKSLVEGMVLLTADP